MRIAILEDDPDQLALLQRWLVQDGHDVHGYLTGREAMMRAIALAEAGARVIWPAAEVTSALTLTEARWPSFLAAYQHGNVLTNTGTTVVTDDTSADEENAEELQKISGVSTA